MAAKDSCGEFSFICIGLEKGNGKEIHINHKGTERCTARQLQDILIDAWHDDTSFIARKALGIITKGNKGKGKVPCLMEHY